MAGGALDFLINIKQQLTGGNVAGELSTLEAKIKGETKALQQLEAWMKRIQSGNSVDIAQYQKVQGLIDQKKSNLAGLSEELAGMGAKTEEAGGAAEGLGAKLGALKAGPLGAVIAALIVVGTLLVLTAYKITAFALSVADAHRSFMLVLAGATGTAAAASVAADAIARVASRSAVAQGELEQMARSLAVAKLQGQAFEDTLGSLATLASVAGPEAAKKLEELAKKSAGLGHFEFGTEALAGLGISIEDIAQKMGVSVAVLQANMKAGKITVEQGLDAMNQAIRARFGDVAARQLLGFDVQMMKLKENVGKLFKDVGIEGFLKGLHDVTSLLDENTASGRALRLMMTTIFTALFDTVGKLGPYVRAFFEGMIIGALLTYIAVMKVVRVFQQAFGSDTKSGIDWINVAMYAGIGLVGALVAGVVLLTAVMLALAILTAPLWLPFLLMTALVIGVVIGLMMLFAKIGAALGDIDLDSAATNMINGLVNGIKSGAGAVFGAIADLASGVKAKFASLLGIRSPSVVFRTFGRFTAEGYAQGVDAGADDAQASVQAMVSAPDAGGGAGGGRGGGIRLEKLADKIEIHGRDAEDIFAQLEERVIALLERADLGGPVPEGAP